MRRVTTVRPRDVYDPETGAFIGREAAVSREDVHAALADMEAVLHVCGGVLVVAYGREPTDVEGEMATNGVVLTWQDRANAKPKPEQAVQAAPPPPPAPEPAQVARDQALQAAAAEAVAQAAGEDEDPQAQLQAAVDAALPPAVSSVPGEEPEEDDSTVHEQLATVQ